jgi:Domain of unknown function (DUF3597)
MGMFTDFMKKIFVHSPVAENPNAPTTPPKAGGPVHGAPPTPQINVPGAGSHAAATATATEVDVAAILDKLASESKEKLDWKHSIVDMMKLVHMDSSLASRRELAKELNYSGDTNDSAAMNVWLHKEVIKKLAANGGRVPADLLD